MAAIAYSLQPVSTAPLIRGRFAHRGDRSATRQLPDAARRQLEGDGPDAPPASSRTRNGALKTKWKSFVHFFALPIRQYYQQPPGLSYRQRQVRNDPNRRGSLILDSDDYDSISVWACPTYNCEVGDDEMVLFKAAEARQEARDALAATLQIQPSVTSLSTRATPHRPAQQDNSSSGLVGAFEQHETADAPAPAPPTAADEGPQEAEAPLPAAHEEAAPDYELLASPPAGTAHLPEDAPPAPCAASIFPVMEDANASDLSLASTSSRPRAFHRSLSGFSAMMDGERPRLRSTMRPSFLRRQTQTGSLTADATHTAGDGAASEPFNTMLLRGQFSPPKRGLTAQQMTFLSSVESLGRYGLSTPLEGSPQLGPPTPTGAATPRTAPRSSRPRTAPQVDYFGPQVTSSLTR
ncbi:uncharacterized protein PFL1_00105 [Pseudozyma flocculosa PF-1]|uniref:Uncharacterized protein n=1 Tax=Pseudozyma flocculosa TaxID=84751 RepID=A0A5C3ET17_9BASI|nr:uncharacterized protein PFL1_00105 [Pseudozyma flocculosa PF-1]EPQ31906.1 hypothetical protein PFL1_00105 [Pseudozyma flocculosa PF-1]SPO35182.1 uncharacterized protein PSFLO_00653 [Pseudozyma flocculosa]